MLEIKLSFLFVFFYIVIALEKLWIMNASRIIWLLAYAGGGWLWHGNGLCGLVLATLTGKACWLLSHVAALFYLNWDNNKQVNHRR